MKDNIQPYEVIESNLLDPTKETDLNIIGLDLASEGTKDFTSYMDIGLEFWRIRSAEIADQMAKDIDKKTMELINIEQRKYRKNGKSKIITEILKP